MAAPNPITNLRLPSHVRRHLDVATAGASEALTKAHAREALRLVALVSDEWSLDQTLDFYFSEMSITGQLGTAVRNRVLVRMDEEEREQVERPSLDLSQGPRGGGAEAGAHGNGSAGWQRFRPDRLVQQMRQRQQRSGEVDRWAQLAIAQAEEAVIAVHVDNAMDFVALLEEHLTLHRAVNHYVDAIGLSGCRAQAVVQRAMARLGEALVGPHPGARGGVARD